MALQWLRLIEGCSRMLGEQPCPQSVKRFVDRTGMQDYLTIHTSTGGGYLHQVKANHSIRLRDIQSAIIEDNNVFENIQSVSISTINRVLKRHQMKQLHHVPLERNGDRVKELRYQYVQCIMELESSEPPHNFIYLDEAGVNLAKGRRHGRDVMGHRATVVPGQWGGNVTMCAAISEHGVLTRIPIIGPYNTQHRLTFLDTLYRDLIHDDDRGLI